MRIQRHHELGPVDPRPGSEVDMVTPNHPPEVEIQTLAGAPIGRSGKEVPDPLACRPAAIHTTEVNLTGTGAEIVKGRADVFSVRAVSAEKKPFDRTRRLDHVTQDDKERDKITPTDPPVP